MVVNSTGSNAKTENMISVPPREISCYVSADSSNSSIQHSNNRRVFSMASPTRSWMGNIALCRGNGIYCCSLFMTKSCTMHSFFESSLLRSSSARARFSVPSSTFWTSCGDRCLLISPAVLPFMYIAYTRRVEQPCFLSNFTEFSICGLTLSRFHRRESMAQKVHDIVHI